MFLDEIANHVRRELEVRQRRTPPAALRDRELFNLPRRGFESSLKGAGRRIIAEVKRASPSKGLIRQEFDPWVIARNFALNGASALSVLTEERFFRGSLLYLEQIRKTVSLPLLRKDFILDGYQLLETRSFGADGVLFVAALVDFVLLRELLDQAYSLSLDPLVEVHTESEMESALKVNARLIGINNRDLKTFEVKLDTTERLLPMVPPGILVVCESGIETREQIMKLESLGAHIFLVGESLMRAPDPGAKLRELLKKD